MTWEHSFDVMGLPEPQGSARAFVRGKRAIITSDNKGLAAWRQAVRYEAQRYVECTDLLLYDRDHFAVSLALEFRFPRPKSRSKRLIRHSRQPDLDKLIRSVGDALTGVIMEDDSMIDELVVRKGYCDQVFSRPGVKVAFSAGPIKTEK